MEKNHYLFESSDIIKNIEIKNISNFNGNTRFEFFDNLVIHKFIKEYEIDNFI